MMLSAMAHPDLNRLLNVLLPFAELMSSEDGEFGPKAHHAPTATSLEWLWR
jgi:hypothetical protein